MLRDLHVRRAALIIGVLAVLASVLASPGVAYGASILDVRDFGATGDGAHDDTSAIQTALDRAASGDSVFVPAGTYSVSRAGSNYALRIPSGVSLYGAGDASVIRLAAGQGAGIRVVTAKDASNVRLENLAVDGNDAAQGVWDKQNHAVFFSHVTDAAIRGVTVRNVAGDGIYLHDRTSAVVENCRLIAGPDPRIGINFAGAVDTIIRNNYIQGWDWAVKAELNENAPAAERVAIYRNKGVLLRDGGIALNGHVTGSFVYDVLIAGNRFESLGSRSVWLKGARRVQVVGNVSEGGGSAVQVVADVRDADIRSNDFVDQSAGVAIREAGDYGPSSNITVRDNLFREARYAAASDSLGAVSGITVMGNQLLSSGAVPLYYPDRFLAPVVVQANRVGGAAQPLPYTPENVDPAQFGTNPRTTADLPPLTLPEGYLFADLTRSHPFAPAVEFLVERGVIDGYGDGRFGVAEPVKRAQLAKMASLAFGLHDGAVASGPSGFVDVPAGSSYPFDFVDEAADRGLVSGFSDGTFRPWEDITRVQLVRILVRAGAGELQVPPSGWDPGFGDVPTADRGDVAKAAFNGIVNGKSERTFDPYGVATRGQVSAMLYRLLNR